MPEAQGRADGYEHLVLGIDPGTAITGYGAVVHDHRGNPVLLACGVIRTPADMEMHLRLKEIFIDM